MNIAVTGCLGSGKSTVSKILAATLQTELIDADQLCRRQMLPGSEGYEEFNRVFANRFLQGDGKIDRILLRQAVFEDDAIRVQLESILHPIVRRQISSRCSKYETDKGFLVVEVPLLYEVGWQEEFDTCVVVYVSESHSLQRVMTRDEMSAEEIKRVLDAQLPIDTKLDYADFVVDNSGTFVSTVHQISWLSRILHGG